VACLFLAAFSKTVTEEEQSAAVDAAVVNAKNCLAQLRLRFL
jgi:hypothetical protein